MDLQYDYDLAVIGAGPGGYVAAIKAAQNGMKTAVIECGEIGGTCLNRGCIPTKTLLHAAELYREIKGAEAFGIHAQNVTFDTGEISARKEEVVAQLRGGIEQLFKANKIASIAGKATITGVHQLTVESPEGSREIIAQNILIATGSVPSLPPIKGISLPGVVTSDALLSGNMKPYRSLIIIGGGVIGVEFASVYSALGCEVTVIEAMERILPPMDREISQNLAMILKKRGVKIYTSAKVAKISEENGLACTFEQKGTLQTATAEGVLVAVGRKPNTQGLFGGQFSVECDRGAVTVNDRFQTSVPSVYAIGDVIRGIQLAHVASAQGINAVCVMLGKPAAVNLSAVPSCVYTDPEIACVGMTADEAKERGIAVKAGKFLMSANAKTVITRQERGFIKLMFEEKTGALLGAQLMCARATDMVGELAFAVTNGLTQEQLASVIRPHPTFCEGITEAAEDAEGAAVHILPKLR